MASVGAALVVGTGVSVSNEITSWVGSRVADGNSLSGGSVGLPEEWLDGNNVKHERVNSAAAVRTILCIDGFLPK